MKHLTKNTVQGKNASIFEISETKIVNLETNQGHIRREL